MSVKLTHMEKALHRMSTQWGRREYVQASLLLPLPVWTLPAP